MVMLAHPAQEHPDVAQAFKPIKVSSEAFKPNGFIPKRYTCDGPNISPSLYIDRIPDSTRSFAIILDDADAPTGSMTHWVAWNIPFSHYLQEDLSAAMQGINDFNLYGYYGPFHPEGTHRYTFKVYALDCTLGLPQNSRKNDLEKAMRGHITGHGELTGLYARG
jgi:Raf kinase inhibitor-like YbhB/YbcL family protein